MKRITMPLLMLAMLTAPVVIASAQDLSPKALDQRLVERRAVDAVIWGSFHDSSGSPLEGGTSYRLHVPAKVPVREFWSVTVHSLTTASFFLNSTRLTLSSLEKEVQRNADGSVAIYFGPTAPAGKESNWLYTPAGEKWFPWFRVYGPEKPIMDKSWKLPDIEKAS